MRPQCTRRVNPPLPPHDLPLHDILVLVRRWRLPVRRAARTLSATSDSCLCCCNTVNDLPGLHEAEYRCRLISALALITTDLHTTILQHSHQQHTSSVAPPLSPRHPPPVPYTVRDVALHAQLRLITTAWIPRSVTRRRHASLLQSAYGATAPARAAPLRPWRQREYVESHPGLCQ